MHKIGDDTATATPVDGEYTEGGAGGSPPATIIKAPWLNSVQRELINALSLFGISPSSSDDGQLKKSLQRLISSASFAPHQANTPNMTVVISAGRLWNNDVVLSAEQVTGTIAAPITNPRIDRVVVNASTGILSVVTGAESATPTPPAIPYGNFPIAKVNLNVSTTAITDADITDERPIFFTGSFTEFIEPTGKIGSTLSAVVAGLNSSPKEIGPTTGASTILWDAMNSVPLSARYIHARIDIYPHVVDPTQASKLAVYIRSADALSGGNIVAQWWAKFANATYPLRGVTHTYSIIIPVSQARFDCWMTVDNVESSANTEIHFELLGWG